MLKRLALLPALLIFACALAALYGAVHNQISYTVAPAYFHEFKFIQFDLDPSLHTRLGASLIGVLASWWMGLILSVPIFLAGLFVKTNAGFVRTFLIAATLVMAVTLAMGLGALVVAWTTFGPDTLPWWTDNRDLSDPVAFARAGQMHNFSYLGGMIGALVGLTFTIWSAWQSRRTAR